MLLKTTKPSTLFPQPEQPKGKSYDQIYQLCLLPCWNLEASKRPSMKEIVQIIQKIDDEIPKITHYIN